MAITYLENTAIFDGTVNVDDAEQLLEWIQKYPGGIANMATCTHIHAACLQVLMAARAPVAIWPQDNDFMAWLTSAWSV